MMSFIDNPSKALLWVRHFSVDESDVRPALQSIQTSVPVRRVIVLSSFAYDIGILGTTVTPATTGTV